MPNALIDAVMCSRIAAEDAQAGFILDGYPRTRAQAVTLNTALDTRERRLSAAILLEVSDDEVLRRLSGRRVCEACGAVYHTEFAPPRRDGRCDLDGARLEHRQDDLRETIERRLEVFHTETQPLVEFYEAQGILIRIAGEGTREEIQSEIQEAIAAPGRRGR